jgi:hypothetical protein
LEAAGAKELGLGSWLPVVVEPHVPLFKSRQLQLHGLPKSEPIAINILNTNKTFTGDIEHLTGGPNRIGMFRYLKAM